MRLLQWGLVYSCPRWRQLWESLHQLSFEVTTTRKWVGGLPSIDFQRGAATASILLRLFFRLPAFKGMTTFETGAAGLGQGVCIPVKCKAPDKVANTHYICGCSFPPCALTAHSAQPSYICGWCCVDSRWLSQGRCCLPWGRASKPLINMKRVLEHENLEGSCLKMERNWRANVLRLPKMGLAHKPALPWFLHLTFGNALHICYVLNYSLCCV